MTRDRAATLTASIGAGLLFGTAGLHHSAYGSVVNAAPAELQPLMAALWVACGASLVIAALLTVAVTPLFIVRRRALLAVAALVPLSIAILQIAYLGFLPPTALLLVDSLVLVIAGELGRARQALPDEQRRALHNLPTQVRGEPALDADAAAVRGGALAAPVKSGVLTDINDGVKRAIDL